MVIFSIREIEAKNRVSLIDGNLQQCYLKVITFFLVLIEPASNYIYNITIRNLVFSLCHLVPFYAYPESLVLLKECIIINAKHTWIRRASCKY
jgi:hypothetical protein